YTPAWRVAGQVPELMVGEFWGSVPGPESHVTLCPFDGVAHVKVTDPGGTVSGVGLKKLLPTVIVMLRPRRPACSRPGPRPCRRRTRRTPPSPAVPPQHPRPATSCSPPSRTSTRAVSTACPCYPYKRRKGPGRCLGPRDATSENGELLVRFPLQSVGREPGREHRVAGGEPAERQEEHPGEEHRGAEFGEPERGARAAVDRGHHLQVALEPDAREAHDRKPRQDGRRLLRPHAQQADEREHKDQEEHRR